MAAVESYRDRFKAVAKRDEADNLMREMLEDNDILQINASELVVALDMFDNSAQHPEGSCRVQYFRLYN